MSDNYLGQMVISEEYIVSNVIYIERENKPGIYRKQLEKDANRYLSNLNLSFSNITQDIYNQ
jgi:hypothetical protein